MSSGRMTTLQGVNKMLRALGSPRATALDTGGTSLVAEAEALLDQIYQEIQAEGWTTNTTEKYEMKVPLIVIAASGGSGSFSYDEEVTESVSGAVGIFKYIGASVHLVYKSGTFTGGQTLTGASSGATRTGGALVNATSNALYVNPAWVRVTRNQSEPLRIVKRGDQLYNETDQTALFTSSVMLDVSRLLYFVDLPFNLANYVACKAALEFQRQHKRGQIDDVLLRDEMNQARRLALVEDEDLRRTNVLTTPEASRIKGSRIEYNEAGL